MAGDQVHQLHSGARPWGPTWLCRSGRAAHSQAIIDLGAGRGPGRAQMAEAGSSQASSQPCTSAARLSEKRIRAAAGSPMKTPVSVHGPGPLGVPKQILLTWPVPRSHSRLIVGSTGPVNHILWGPEVSLMLFLISGAIISNSLSIYEKHLNNTPHPSLS